MANWITYEDVAKAAAQLWANKQAPSIAKVREVLGRGSNTIIQKHLNRWREEHKASDTPLPDPITQKVQAVWNEITKQQQLTLRAIQQDKEQAIAQAQEQVKQAQQQAEQVLQNYQHVKQELELAQADIQTLRDKLTIEEKRYLITHEGKRALEQQIQQLKADQQQQLTSLQQQRQAETAALKTQLDQQQQHYENRLHEQTLAFNEKSQVFTQQLEALRLDKQALSKDLEQAKATEKTHLKKHQDLDTEHKELLRKLKATEINKQQLLEQQHRYEKELAKAQARSEQLQQQLEDCKQLVNQQQRQLLAYGEQIGKLADRLAVPRPAKREKTHAKR